MEVTRLRSSGSMRHTTRNSDERSPAVQAAMLLTGQVGALGFQDIGALLGERIPFVIVGTTCKHSNKCSIDVFDLC